jgi:hypothetical protein
MMIGNLSVKVVGFYIAIGLSTCYAEKLFFLGNSSGGLNVNNIDNPTHPKPLVPIGEHHSSTDTGGAIRAQSGYKFCKVQLDIDVLHGIRESPSSTFTTSLQNNGQQIAYYFAHEDFAHHPFSNLNAIVNVSSVPRSDDGKECMHDGALWQCGKNTPAGQRDCGADQPGAFSGPWKPSG